MKASPQTGAAAQEQAKADVYAQQAAKYAQMANANRAAASAPATLAATQPATADAIGTSSRASATTSLAIASSGNAVAGSGDSGVVQKTLAGVAAGAATRRSDYEKAAALADKLAANAQRTANFYQAKASELSGGVAGGGAK